MNTNSTVHHTSQSLIYRNTQKVGNLAAGVFWFCVPPLILGFIGIFLTLDAPEILRSFVGQFFASVVVAMILSVVTMKTSDWLLKKMRSV